MSSQKKISGLSPNTEYAVSLEVKFATNAAKNSVGIGGSPGEGVFLKAGSLHEEPRKVNLEGYYTMNLDKGNQSTRGENMVVIGTISSESTDGVSYALETRNHFIHCPRKSKWYGSL